jgi:hypothetical protein
VDGGAAWENRRQIGMPAALMQTVAGVVRSPASIFTSLKGGRSHLGAILLVVILGFFSSLIQSIWTMVLVPVEAKAALESMLNNFTTAPIPEGFMEDAFRAFMVGQVFLSPIFSVLALYLEAGLVWLVLMILGVPGRRFTIVLLVIAVAEVASLAVLIPQLGGMIAMVLGVVFVTTGLSVRLRISRGRALVSAIAPSVILLFILVLVTGAMSAVG